MNTFHVSLRPIPDAEFLKEDDLSMCEAVIENGRINTHDDLLSVLQAGGEDTILLIPRRSIDSCYLEMMAKQIADEKCPEPEDACLEWYALGGVNASNAMPHIHTHYNCHASAVPVECSTAFFLRRSVIHATREASQNLRHSLSIREQLQNALQWIDVPVPEGLHNFFVELHSIEPGPREGNLALLQCARDIQERAHALGGIKEVGLGTEGYGIIGIPHKSLHGRSVREELTRSRNTAWRYIPEETFRASDTPPASPSASASQ